MTRHQLQNRNEKELVWFQGRGMRKAAAACGAWEARLAAMTQQGSDIAELTGTARINDSGLLN